VDVLTNTLGSGFGARLAYPIRRLDTQKILHNLYTTTQLFYLRLISIYCLVVTIILLIPIYFNTFVNWNKNYHLLIGNELTMNRPWQGTIYKLLIYNRILKSQEIKNLSATDLKNKTPKRFTKDLLIEYNFNSLPPKISGMLNDQMDLIPKNQLTFDVKTEPMIISKENPLLLSKKSASELVNLLQRTNQLSVAIWFKPGSLQQVGPARIVSLSLNPMHRNFTLGQTDSSLIFRVRTPLTWHNASRVQLMTDPILTTDMPQFVVATFHRGESRLFYNGQIVSSKMYSISSYLPLIIGFGRNRISKMMFYFMLFFPLGWLSRGLVQRRIWKRIISSLIVMIPVFIVSLVTTISFRHALDVQLLFACSVISALLFGIGLIYEFVLSK
jgi:hypothetical protein